MNSDLGINNKIQDSKIGTMGVCMGGGRVNGGVEDEGIWLMDFIYIY
jgi:dienelactone hydrolase